MAIPGQDYGVLWFRGRNTVATHVAWLLTYGEMPPVGLFVLHKCDTPRCCNPAHLFLGTQRDNCQDKSRKLRQNGAKHALAKLTDDDVRQIRELAAGGMLHTTIGERFGVTGANVGYIVKRATWKHVA
jgi:hypothetical protein